MTGVVAQAWFSNGASGSGIDVEPGATSVVQLTIVNLGDSTDTWSLVPTGLASGWTTIRPASVTLFGGAQESVDLEVRPPMLPSTTAGPTALTVRVVSQGNPDDLTTAEATLIVGDHSDRRLTILQPAQRARRRATYEMTLENRGNTQASCRMHLVDPTSRVSGDFDPPAVGVDPGGTALVRVRLRTERWQWHRRSRTIPFRVDAAQAGAPPATAAATFVQAPVVPERLWGRLIATLAVLGALAALWFGVVLPAIDDAAEDAVADAGGATTIPAPTTTASGTDEPTPTATTIDTATDEPAASSTTPPPTVTEPITPGEPFAQRLTSDVAAGQSGSQSVTPEEGTSLEVTDVLLQNTNQDAGTATLLRGTDVLLTWKLDFILGDAPLAVRTPIVVAPGEELTFQVTCTGVGEGAPACSPALLLLGRSVEV